jgi:hypothetical protein
LPYVLDVGKIFTYILIVGRAEEMPTVNILDAIKIQIYFNDTQRHQLPHFHAVTKTRQAAISLVDFRVLAGGLGRNQMKKVMDWAKENRAALIQEWDRCNPHRPFQGVGRAAWGNTQ